MIRLDGYVYFAYFQNEDDIFSNKRLVKMLTKKLCHDFSGTYFPVIKFLLHALNQQFSSHGPGTAGILATLSGVDTKMLSFLIWQISIDVIHKQKLFGVLSNF